MNYQEFYNKLTPFHKIELAVILGIISYGVGLLISGRDIKMAITVLLLGSLYLTIVVKDTGYFNKKEKIKFGGNDLANESK